MDRETYARTLRMMERCRELMQDAEPEEYKRLRAEYIAMANAVCPDEDESQSEPL